MDASIGTGTHLVKTSRRDFLKATGLTVGAMALPSWSFDARAAEQTATKADKSSLADLAISTARKLGASYADIRINRYRNESISTRERQVQNVSHTQSFGFGVRVLLKGTWGFAASGRVSPEEVRGVAREAIEIARANARFQRKPIELVPVPKVVATWKSSFEKDPFDVPIEDKVQFLLRINETALKVKGVGFVNSSMLWVNEQKFYASTDGSRIEQYLIRGFPNFTVTAVDRATGDFQTRNSLGG